MDGKVIPLISALIQADTTLRELDQVVLRFLQLQGIHIKLLIDVPGIEQKSMCWDGEQGLRQFLDAFDVEVLKVLGTEYDRRFLLTHTLHKVTDIFNSGEVCQEQIEFINPGCRMPFCQKLITHIGQDVKEQSILHIPTGLQQSFYAKHDKPI